MENGLKGGKRKEEDQLRDLILCPLDNDGVRLSFGFDDANGQKGKEPACITDRMDKCH